MNSESVEVHARRPRCLFARKRVLHSHHRCVTSVITPYLFLMILNCLGLAHGDLPDTGSPPPESAFDVKPGSSSDGDESAEWDSSFGKSLQPPLDVRPCYPPAAEDETGHNIPLPQLDEQFEARVEAKILQKGHTVDVTEYYDYPNNRGMVRRMKGGVSSIWLYDFTDFESFLIVGNNCWLSDMRKEGFQFFNFTMGEHNGHIGGVTDLFNFGTQYNETFISGNETVGGIPVNHWTSCIEWDRFGTVFQLDYYFTKPGYSTAVGKKQIPVRAVLKGQARSGHEAMHTFHHIYDFMFYRPGPIQDVTVFEVPHGTVCKHRTVQKKRPDLPDSFLMQVEMVQPQDHVVSLRKYYYDYNLKLSRYDLRPNAKSMITWGESYGYRPLTLIHDYSRGIQYVLDSISRNCSRSAITLDTVDADPRMTDPAHVIMRHGRELFDMDQLSFSYQGKRQFRGISCRVWAALRVNWPQEGTNTTVEVYFNRENWTMEESDPEDMEPDIVGLWLTLVDSTDNYVSEWISHIYSYSSGDPDLAVFDVSDCYSKKEKMDINFQMKGSYQNLVRLGLLYSRQAVQIQVAEVGNLHPMRVTNIKFDESDSSSTQVTVTLLEEANLEDDTLKPDIVTSTTDAYHSIMKQANSDSGFNILVPYDNVVQKYTVLPGSVMVVQSDNRATSKFVQTHRGHQYSSGSMAVLGICMLLLGIATGSGGMFFHKLKKRPMDIPYRVQD